MTPSEAMGLVRRLQTAVQKVRSGLAETGLPEDVLAYASSPWLFGDGCVLRATEAVLASGSVTGGDLYNLMWIASRDEVRGLLGPWLAVNRLPDFPEPDFAWIADLR